MSRRYALRFYAFDGHQRIVPLPMKAGQVILNTDQPDLHIWAEPVRRLGLAKEYGGWPPNLDWPTDNQPSADHESIIVLFVPTAALSSGQFFQELIGGETALRRIEPLPGGEAKGNRPRDYRPSPTITVSLENAMALYEESAGLDCDPPNTTTWKEQRETNRRLYSLGLDHRVKFLDSSIWHRYVAFDEGFEKNLLARLSDTVMYSDLRLYRSLASLEFQCRMLLNSFIVALGANGHHESVTPFKFHSETWMAQQSEHILQFLREEGEAMRLIDLQRNALIVDDQANQPISLSDGSLQEGDVVPTKRDLIQKWLTSGPRMLNLGIDDFTEGTEGIIKSGIGKMKFKTFDVIFLDYLLGKGGILRANGREYGHEFLLEIATGQQLPHRGPLGRYWIFPISSFPFAFADKLRQLGMEGVSDRWYISEGGDPIATPEMFRFNFLRMALLQISECYLYPAATVRLLERFSGIEDRKAWGGAVRTTIEVKEVSRRLLATDQTQGSLLARSMRSFLEKQKRYEQQMRHLKAMAALLERPLNAARYISIQEQQTKFKGGKPDHRAARIVDKEVNRLLSDIDTKHEDTMSKISEAIESHRAFLNLADMGLLSLPPQIGNCVLLEHLILSGNRIAILPTEISSLTQLVRLDLSYNDFSKVPSLLKTLASLEWLDLRDNPGLTDLADIYEGKEEIKMLLDKATQRTLLHNSFPPSAQQP